MQAFNFITLNIVGVASQLFGALRAQEVDCCSAEHEPSSSSDAAAGAVCAPSSSSNSSPCSSGSRRTCGGSSSSLSSSEFESSLDAPSTPSSCDTGPTAPAGRLAVTTAALRGLFKRTNKAKQQCKAADAPSPSSSCTPSSALLLANSSDSINLADGACCADQSSSQNDGISAAPTDSSSGSCDGFTTPNPTTPSKAAASSSDDELSPPAAKSSSSRSSSSGSSKDGRCAAAKHNSSNIAVKDSSNSSSSRSRVAAEGSSSSPPFCGLGGSCHLPPLKLPKFLRRARQGSASGTHSRLGRAAAPSGAAAAAPSTAATAVVAGAAAVAAAAAPAKPIAAEREQPSASAHQSAAAARPTAAAPPPPPSRGAERHRIVVRAAFIRDCDTLFEGGAYLSEGGQGEVRLMQLDGQPYVIKREKDSMSKEVYLKNLLNTPWVQTPLAVKIKGDTRFVYSLYKLAAGDLQQAAHGILELMPDGTKEGESMSAEAEAAVKAIIAQLVVGLGKLHDIDWQHRDFKPANVLISLDNFLCLADLGLAGPASEDSGGMGTEFFMAPEQVVASDEEVMWRQQWACLRERLHIPANNRPVDVWAIGATALLLVLPLERVSEILQCAGTKGWRGVKQLLPAWLPADLADLICKGMLARSPGRRLTVAGIKRRPFFRGVDWGAVEGRVVPLPIDLVAMAKAGQQLQKEQEAADDAGRWVAMECACL